MTPAMRGAAAQLMANEVGESPIEGVLGLSDVEDPQEWQPELAETCDERRGGRPLAVEGEPWSPG